MEGSSENEEILRRRPDRERTRTGWRVIRTPAKGTYTAMCISHDLIGAELHWFGGRKTPCWLTDECPMCQKGKPRDWYSYVAFVAGKNGERGIYEVPFGALWAWDEAFGRNRTLRGLEFKAWRAPARSTGAVMMGFKTGTVISKDLPKAPDVEQILKQMFNVPYLFERTANILATPTQMQQRMKLRYE